MPQTNFGQQQPTQQAQAPSQPAQQPNFGGVPNAPAWGQTVNPNNGQQA